jgi:hypothetical protein
MRRLLIAAAVCTASFVTAHAAEPAAPLAKITVVFDQALPNVPGKSMKGVLVEYGPGGSSPAHIHAPSAFIYATVLEGAIRSQVNDGPPRSFTRERTFPNGRATAMPSAPMPAIPSLRSCLPFSWSIPPTRS